MAYKTVTRQTFKITRDNNTYKYKKTRKLSIKSSLSFFDKKFLYIEISYNYYIFTFFY